LILNRHERRKKLALTEIHINKTP